MLSSNIMPAGLGTPPSRTTFPSQFTTQKPKSVRKEPQTSSSQYIAVRGDDNTPRQQKTQYVIVNEKDPVVRPQPQVVVVDSSNSRESQKPPPSPRPKPIIIVDQTRQVINQIWEFVINFTI